MLSNFFYNQKLLKQIKNSEINSNLKKNQYLWINAKTPTQDELEILKKTFDIHPTTLEVLCIGF